MYRILFTLFCCLIPVTAEVSVSASTTVLVGTDEPVALQKAADDLVADFGRVFGTAARLVHRPAEAGAVTICVCLDQNLPSTVQKPGGSEVLLLQTVASPWNHAPVKKAVVLTGSDMRGAIYAVYQFSQKYLGVDPLYYWTDRLPVRRSEVTLPDAFVARDGPPSFRYRGWFLNDEDLLTGWKPGAKDGTGIALEAWDKVFEAILRLKGNMVVPGTFIFPDEPQVRAAGDRGLIISQHHIEVLGTNTYRWPEDRPYSFASRPDLLLSAWTHAIEQYAPKQDVIWTVGYRGRHDRPFWSDDALAGSTDREHAAAIQSAIEKQIAIVRQRRDHPFFLMNAWMESVPLLQSGLLKLPPEVVLVWPDNGHGIVRDEGAIRAGQGVYYHTAMYDAMANQLSEMVPLERIQRELGRAARAGATEYLLINTSDVRPVPMTTRAVMELAWDARPWVSDNRQAMTYLDKWCREEFGAGAAPLMMKYYQAYFEAPGRYGPRETETLADNAYHTVAREILAWLMTGKYTAPEWRAAGTTNLADYAARYGRAAEEAEPRWARARDLATSARGAIPVESRQAFLGHVQTQLDVNQHSNHMLAEVARVVSANSNAGKLQRINAAIADLDAVLRALNTAEFGKWQGFYRNDLMVNVRFTLALASACKDKLEGKPLSVDVRGKDAYIQLKAYQGNRRVPL